MPCFDGVAGLMHGLHLLEFKKMLRSLTLSQKLLCSLVQRKQSLNVFGCMRTFAAVASPAKRLSLALKKEFEQEVEVMSSDYYESENATIKEYLKKHPEWKISEKSMSTEVVLKKQHGSEEISVLFEKEREDFDAAMSEEAQAQQKGEKTEDGEEAENEQGASLMLPFTVVVSKGEKGSMCFDCTYRQSGLQIETSKFYQDSKIAVEDSAVADHSRRTVYEGPDLTSYDEALLEKFYQYLEERGINNEFGLFIDTFAILKERRDYADWLRASGKFLDL